MWTKILIFGQIHWCHMIIGGFSRVYLNFHLREEKHGTLTQKTKCASSRGIHVFRHLTYENRINAVYGTTYPKNELKRELMMFVSKHAAKTITINDFAVSTWWSDRVSELRSQQKLTFHIPHEDLWDFKLSTSLISTPTSSRLKANCLRVPSGLRRN